MITQIKIPVKAPNFQVWRFLVLERDEYTCQLCGRQDNHVMAHHIIGRGDNPELIFTVSNGQTLCKDCHNRVTSVRRKKKAGNNRQAISPIKQSEFNYTIPRIQTITFPATLNDIKQELKVSKRTVYRLIKSGKLKAVRVGNLWRMREEDLEAFRRELK